MSDYFPRDLLMKILAGLPVKSLFRFMCVSKEFHIFITTHFNNHVDDDDEENNNGYHLIYHWSGHYSIHHPKTFDEYFRFKLPFDIPELLHVNSCNGLVCLFGCPDDIVLWNPLIRKFLTLPEPSVSDRIRIDVSEHFCYAHGLGFDRRNNDYKVIRIVYRKREHGLVILPGEAEVFSLSKRCWRSIKGPTVWAPETTYLRRVNRHMSKVRETRLLPAYVNGVVHWICFGALLLFDMSDEVFRNMKLPHGLRNGVRAIAACGGSLLACDFENDHCDVWVMKEYGVAESWMKHIVISDPDLMIWGPVSLSLSSDDELLVSTREGELLFCDRQPQETKKLGDLYLDKCTYHSLILLEEEGAEVR